MWPFAELNAQAIDVAGLPDAWQRFGWAKGQGRTNTIASKTTTTPARKRARSIMCGVIPKSGASLDPS